MTAGVYVDTDFIHYSDGIFESDECGDNEMNHFVLITGWGTDEDSGKDYWIVKNSWGTDWGNDGYIKIRRNSNSSAMGMCAIASQVAYIDNL